VGEVGILLMAIVNVHQVLFGLEIDVLRNDQVGFGLIPHLVIALLTKRDLI
jgi:hypothetical protein